MKKLLVCAAIAAMNVFAASAQAGYLPSGAIPAGGILGPGETLQSANGKYVLSMQASDGHLLVYRKADNKLIWANYSLGGVGAWAKIQEDRNFVVYKAGPGSPSSAVWSSKTNEQVWDAEAYLMVELNGAVQLVTRAGAGGQVYWSTPADPSVCWNGEYKTLYAMCLRPGTKWQSNYNHPACSYAEAEEHARKYINDGAAMGVCK